MPALPTSGVEIDTNEENGVSSLLDKDWNWKWDYGELYEANGFNVDVQRATSGLSTESLFNLWNFTTKIDPATVRYAMFSHLLFLWLYVLFLNV